MTKFWKHCFETQPVPYTIAWISTPIFACVTIAISAAHMHKLNYTPVSGFRQLYLKICFFPILYVIMNALVIMVTPLASELLDILLLSYEAFVLSSFAILMFQMLSTKTRLTHESSVRDLMYDSDTAGERIINALKAKGPLKHFATGPLCCCCKPCTKEHNLTSNHLLTCFYLLQQYMIFVPGQSLVSLFVNFVAPEQYPTAKMWCEALGETSKLLALWGLFVLYFGTRRVLHEWRVTEKFLAIKGIVFIQCFQKPAIRLIVMLPFVQDTNPCLTHVPLMNFWNSYFLCIWSMVMAHQMKRAFRWIEINEDTERFYFPGNFELDLRRDVQLTRMNSRSRAGSYDTGIPKVDDSLFLQP